MTASPALALCLALQRAHASLRLKLDDELGTHHGVSFSDFVLLDLLAQADGGQRRVEALVGPLGQPPSAVLRQLIALEKIGLVARSGAGRERHAALRPSGLTLVPVARETAASVCDAAVAAVDPTALETTSTALAALAGAPSLAPH